MLPPAGCHLGDGDLRGAIFTSMRSSASLHVIWAKSEEEEEEGTFWGKKAFLGTIVK